MSDDKTDKIDIRLDLDEVDVGTLDSIAPMRSMTRKRLAEAIVRAWCERERHKAMVICRVAGINPLARGGSGPATPVPEVGEPLFSRTGE